ncbi:MAG: flagellar basal body P-ring formation chaperone FlgA [Calditrichia bacterium]
MKIIFTGLLILAGFSLTKANPTVTVPAADIRAAVEQYLCLIFKNQPGSYSLEWLKEVPDVHLLKTADSLSVTLGPEGELPLGQQVARFTFYHSQRPMCSVYLPLIVHYYRQVWVAAARISGGSRIDPGQLRREKKDISRLYGHPVYSENFPGNKVAKHTIAAGKVIDENDLRMPFLVKRGEQLEVDYRSGALRISFEAKALQNGQKDELIWVRITDTRKRLQVKVREKNRAVCL